MSKATPRPWKTIGKFICDSDNVAVAQCGSQMPKTEEENEANAELIVRAVNCHDELVESLETQISFLKSYIENLTDAQEIKFRVESIKKLNDLLKRAKGEV